MLLSTREEGYNLATMKAGPKIAVAAAVLVAAPALLGVLYAGARQRALVSHCRNNLRHLGGLAVRNWENLDKKKTGRLFWQEIREAQYHALDGKWSVPPTEPFRCPLVERSVLLGPQDPASIDYLGPVSVPKSPREMPKGAPIGADRQGNHPSGGHVLRLDTSVEDLPPLIVPATGEAWQEALKGLKE